MKPNFARMSRTDLRSYLLEHRSDTEAISAYIQKISAEAGWIVCPALTSPEDLDRYPEFLNKVRRELD